LKSLDLAKSVNDPGKSWQLTVIYWILRTKFSFCLPPTCFSNYYT
jgi:hypothetical protein